MKNGPTRNLLLRIQVLKITISESEQSNISQFRQDTPREVYYALILAHESPGLGIANVLQLTPPFSDADST